MPRDVTIQSSTQKLAEFALDAWHWSHIRHLQGEELADIIEWLEDLIDRINIQLTTHQSIGRALEHVLQERWKDTGIRKGDWSGGYVVPGGILYGVEFYLPGDEGRYDSIHMVLREADGGYDVEKLLYHPK